MKIRFLPAKPSRSRGFTLIEAMVALVVFSMAAMGIYSFISTQLISLNRLAQLAANEQVLNASIERLKLVDMSKETDGVFTVNDTNVQWHADAVEPWRQGVNSNGAIGLYDFGLLAISLNFTRDNRVTGSYQYRYTAYKKARNMKFEDDEH